jgi:transketolase
MEAFLYAGAHRLGNLTALIDRNHTQLSGTTADILPLGDLRRRLRQFGWQVLEIDGHNFASILGGLTAARQTKSKPTVLICQTILGKGVPLMEGNFQWHGQALSKENYEKAIETLY